MRHRWPERWIFRLADGFDRIGDGLGWLAERIVFWRQNRRARR